VEERVADTYGKVRQRGIGMGGRTELGGKVGHGGGALAACSRVTGRGL